MDDSADVDFSAQKSFTNYLYKYPNLVVMQTFSKAWGLAGIRLGMAFAHETIIDLLNKVKPPYNVNSSSQKKALKRLNDMEAVQKEIKKVKKSRQKFIACNVLFFQFVKLDLHSLLQLIYS